MIAFYDAQKTVRHLPYKRRPLEPTCPCWFTVTNHLYPLSLMYMLLRGLQAKNPYHEVKKIIIQVITLGTFDCREMVPLRNKSMKAHYIAWAAYRWQFWSTRGLSKGFW